MLVLVVGPSGAGKDTLIDRARAALAGDPRFRFVRREITRPADAGGEAHIAVSVKEFATRRAAGAYVLSWEAHGMGYGVPTDIAADLAAGRVVVANVSRAVIPAAMARFPTLVLEITAPPELLAQRLAARRRESAPDIAERLARDVPLPDGVTVARIVNDTTPQAGAEAVLAVLTRAAESARRS